MGLRCSSVVGCLSSMHGAPSQTPQKPDGRTNQRKRLWKEQKKSEILDCGRNVSIRASGGGRTTLVVLGIDSKDSLP